MLTWAILISLAWTAPPPIPSQQPVAAGCDESLMEQARRAAKADNFSQAKAYLARLRDCPGQLGREAGEMLEGIGRREANMNLWSKAQIALGQGRHQEACANLLKIEASQPDFPALRQAKARAGGCDPTSDAIKTRLQTAADRFKEGRLGQARSILEGMLREYPDSAEATDLLNEVKAAQKASASSVSDGAKATETAQRQAFDQLCERAEASLGEGRYSAALDLARQARSLYPGDPRAETLLAKGQEGARLERSELKSILDLFFQGRYQECLERCQLLAGQPHDPAARGLALFFQATSVLALGALKGDLSEENRLLSQRLIDKAVQASPSVSYWWKAVSPKLRRLLEEPVKPRAGAPPRD